MTEPFWKQKTLAAMTRDEWESLCDGCGKCCLQKLEDEETGRIHLTIVACKLLDLESCQCSHYADRQSYVPACVQITPANVGSLTLPYTCAYRTLAEGRDLPAWHPLRTGTRSSVHDASMSVRGWAISEDDVAEEDLEDYVVASEDPS
jgi:uncharacterized cysteine cluster protein YcgN (CxxCxxCC family)